ncbi:oxalate:formate antiporter [Bacillus thuringiensis]|uniref:Oxalate:formate antiporter n=1 Tax=Bacillus thuringiensis TaxID=1428 RepID=A0ABD6SJV4_BACTU|nr:MULTISPECIES: nucleotidyltransferase domain-containing protein [Bacillus]PEF28303.1 oxalate:formate antiporter [Bacillus thuringiensis]PES85701.1 oxalate:formate antiporter [Bacillus thuringiensis]PET90499.1 oxalate:formate antiporter [Bacillus thuringiensis]PEU99302.1 oxalate:formate antiporter [Bacillus sp. AFS012607]PEV41494.1 oxalate:formate antiporter [Bacillus thuringiensis]
MLKQHEDFIQKVKKQIQEDERFIGILAGGSIITNTMDQFSDIDLILVYDSTFQDAIMKNRLQIASGFGHLLSGFTGEHVGEPRLLICLYNAPILHVDLKFVTIDEVSNGVEKPIVVWQRGSTVSQILNKTNYSFPYPDMQWIEDGFWVWIHYAATKLGRGELFEVIDFLSFLRENAIGPLVLIKNNSLPRGVRRIEEDAPDFIEKLEKTVAIHEKESCYNAIKSTISLYLHLRKDYEIDIQVKSEAQQESIKYLEEVYEVI